MPSDPTPDLEAALAEAVAAADALQATFDGIVADSAERAMDDEHDPDGSTVAWEREQLGTLLAVARQTVADLEEARGRAADGTYGRCEVCGSAIGAERLEALPGTRRCVSCAARPAGRGPAARRR